MLLTKNTRSFLPANGVIYGISSGVVKVVRINHDFWYRAMSDLPRERIRSKKEGEWKFVNKKRGKMEYLDTNDLKTYLSDK